MFFDLGNVEFVISRLAPMGTRRTRSGILFFTKSSGFEHDPVKRNGGAPSLAELMLSAIGKIVATH